MIANEGKTIALIQQISARRFNNMAEKTCSVSEAIVQLRESLAGLGLEQGGIAVACCGETRENSRLIAQRLVAAGFGRVVQPAGRPARYETGDGWFSWDSVTQGDDMITLFYRLEADDQPIDYLINEAGPRPGQGGESSEAGGRNG